MKQIVLKKRSVLLFFFLLICLSLGISLRIIPSDAFSPDMITHDVQGDFTFFDLPEINQIADQKFLYLGNGMQAMAFLSEDKQYVFKFFLKHRIHKQIRIRLAPFLEKLLSQEPEKINALPSDKRYVLESYDQVFQKLRTEAGLIAVHLAANSAITAASTASKLPKLQIVDYQGQEHTINLNRVSFVVQKYGSLVKDSFLKMSKKEKRKAILDLEKLLQKIALNGFVNHGKSFNEKNFAFVDHHPIMIDVGNIQFSESQKENPEKEIQRLQKLLKQWKKQHF